MACMCAETFAAECGCGSKAAERYEAYEDPISDRQEYKIKELGGKSGGDMTRSEASDYIKELQGRESGTWRAESSPLPADPRVSPMDDGLHLPADSPALDLPRENAEIGGVDFKADSSPLPPDPRVSPLNTGLYSPSDTPEMAAEGVSKTEVQIEMGDSSGQTEGYRNRIFSVSPIDEGEGSIDYLLDDLETLIEERVSGWNETYDLLNAESFGAESKFDKLAKEIAEEYEEKGKSPKEAMEIGEATAANIGRAKFGKRKFAKMGQKAESFGADEQLEYPCDVCGKPSDYNFQDGTLRWKIKDDEFVVGKPKISVNGDQNDFYCKRHADMNETGIFYAEDDIDFDKSKADRNKDGRISDWERAVGNKVAKGIRESKRAEVGPHVPTRIAATTTPRGVVKTYTSIPAGDGHVVGQFTPDMDYAPSGMYGAESLTSSIEKGFGAVLGIMSGLIVGGFAMGAVSSLSKDDENRE